MNRALIIASRALLVLAIGLWGATLADVLPAVIRDHSPSITLGLILMALGLGRLVSAADTSYSDTQARYLTNRPDLLQISSTMAGWQALGMILFTIGLAIVVLPFLASTS